MHMRAGGVQAAVWMLEKKSRPYLSLIVRSRAPPHHTFSLAGRRRTSASSRRSPSCPSTSRSRPSPSSNKRCARTRTSGPPPRPSCSTPGSSRSPRKGQQAADPPGAPRTWPPAPGTQRRCSRQTTAAPFADSRARGWPRPSVHDQTSSPHSTASPPKRQPCLRGHPRALARLGRARVSWPALLPWRSSPKGRRVLGCALLV